MNAKDKAAAIRAWQRFARSVNLPTDGDSSSTERCAYIEGYAKGLTSERRKHYVPLRRSGHTGRVG